MSRYFTLSGIGLGFYLLGIGVTYLIDISTGSHFLAAWFQFYPILPVLLGLDYILYTIKPDLPIQKPEGFVTTVIIIITIVGFMFSFTPKLVREDLQQWRGHINIDHDFSFGPFTKVNVKNEFTVPAGISTVVIENNTGEVNADTADGQTVSAEAVVKMRIPPKEIKNLQNEFKVTSETVGDTLIIRLEKPTNYPSFRLNRMSVDLSVSVPKGLNVKINNNTGNVNVETIEGNLEVELNTGDILVENVNRNVNLSNHTGSIRADTVLGDANISLKTGRIKVEKIYGKAKIENSTGEIEIEECRDAVNASLNTGNIKVNLAKVNANCILENKMGNIEMELPTAANFSIEANTNMGNIESDFPLSVQQKMAMSSASGAVNAGGPLIKAETKTGNIGIHKL